MGLLSHHEIKQIESQLKLKPIPLRAKEIVKLLIGRIDRKEVVGLMIALETNNKEHILAYHNFIGTLLFDPRFGGLKRTNENLLITLVGDVLMGKLDNVSENQRKLRMLKIYSTYSRIYNFRLPMANLLWVRDTLINALKGGKPFIGYNPN